MAGAVAAAVTVNVVGESATGVPVAVMLTVGSADAVMFTVAVTAARPPSPLEPPVDAVTVASRLVVMVVVASPWLLVTTTVDDNVPAVDVNETETPESRLPSASKTTASSVLVPPEAGTFDGLAVRLIEPAAAPPMSTDRSPEVTPPEKARTTARPDRVPAIRRTVTLPSRVRASAGSIWPMVVGERDQRAVLDQRAARFDHGRGDVRRPVDRYDCRIAEERHRRTRRRGERDLVAARRRERGGEPEGDERPPREDGRGGPAEQERGGCYHGSQRANENSVMHLAGQHERRARPDAGYAMAVLLAGIAIMGIVWTLVVPVWKQSVQREKEAELIFRAGQYARAVALYQRKYANAFPPSVDVLLREKFLRKKYKDPVTNGEFRYLSPLELQAAAWVDDDHVDAARPADPGLPGARAGRTSPGSARRQAPGAHPAAARAGSGARAEASAVPTRSDRAARPPVHRRASRQW